LPLVLAGREKILLDCGIGRKWNAKQQEIYGLGPGPTLLDDLARHGVRPEEVTVVALSHLHLDHAGWLTRRTTEARSNPSSSTPGTWSSAGIGGRPGPTNSSAAPISGRTSNPS